MAERRNQPGIFFFYHSTRKMPKTSAVGWLVSAGVIILAVLIKPVTCQGHTVNEPCDKGQCQPGQYLDKQVCRSCEAGKTFITQANNSCRQCAPCTLPNVYDHEIVLQECTVTSDTVIGCEKSYFRKNECERCSVCPAGQIEIQQCGNFTDTVCSSQATTTDPSYTTQIDLKNVSYGPEDTTGTITEEHSVEPTNSTQVSQADDKVAVIGSVLAAVAVIVILLAVGVYYCRKKCSRNNTENTDSRVEAEKMMEMQENTHH